MPRTSEYLDRDLAFMWALEGDYLAFNLDFARYRLSRQGRIGMSVSFDWTAPYTITEP